MNILDLNEKRIEERDIRRSQRAAGMRLFFAQEDLEDGKWAYWLPRWRREGGERGVSTIPRLDADGKGVRREEGIALTRSKKASREVFSVHGSQSLSVVG